MSSKLMTGRDKRLNNNSSNPLPANTNSSDTHITESIEHNDGPHPSETKTPSDDGGQQECKATWGDIQQDLEDEDVELDSTGGRTRQDGGDMSTRRTLVNDFNTNGPKSRRSIGTVMKAKASDIQAKNKTKGNGDKNTDTAVQNMSHNGTNRNMSHDGINRKPQDLTKINIETINQKNSADVRDITTRNAARLEILYSTYKINPYSILKWSTDLHLDERNIFKFIYTNLNRSLSDVTITEREAQTAFEGCDILYTHGQGSKVLSQSEKSVIFDQEISMMLTVLSVDDCDISEVNERLKHCPGYLTHLIPELQIS